MLKEGDYLPSWPLDLLVLVLVLVLALIPFVVAFVFGVLTLFYGACE